MNATNVDKNSKLIKHGELHLYYPVKFETKLSFSNLCKKLSTNRIVYGKKYESRVYASFNCAPGMKLRFSGDGFGYGFALKNKVRALTNTFFHVKRKYNWDGNIVLSPYITENAVGSQIYCLEIEEIRERIKRIGIDYDQSKRLYGDLYTSSQQRFILAPLRVVLSNKEEVWLNIILIVFSNKMGILKMELPLKDMDISPIKEDAINCLVNAISSNWLDFFPDQDINILDIPNIYLNKLKSINVSIRRCTGTIRNMIISEADYLPNDIDNIPKSILIELYKIVAAPVQELPYLSYVHDAQEYLKNHSWGKLGMKYFFSTTGGVLSIVDRKLLSYYIECYVKENEIKELSEDDEDDIASNLANVICLNIEYAIFILLLKNTNERNDVFSKLTHAKDISRLTKEYNENKVYINMLQEDCYGTVSELIQKMEEKMPYFIKKDLWVETQDAINNILSAAEKQEQEKFVDYVSIGGLMITLVFGIPSIYETVKLLKAVFWFQVDIPILTVENGTILLWGVLNCCLLGRVIKHCLSRKS